jgi:hypothetical protein
MTFKKGYLPRTNTVKDENSYLIIDSHSILARWRNHFSQLFDVHGISNVRQTELYAAELLVPEPRAFESDLTTEKLKSHKSPCNDQIPA